VLYDTEKALTESSKSSLTFPATVGKASAAQVITVSNGGHGELTIISISASDGFAQTNTLYGPPLGSGATCTVSVTFTATETGTLTGTLTVAGNGVVGKQELKLTGTGM
jgi:hypothetical protein